MEMSITNGYDVNNRLEASCTLVSLGTDLLAQSGCLEGVKVTAATYCNLLKVLDACLSDIPLSLLRNFVFMHDNMRSHASRTNQTLLGAFGIQSERLMVRSPASRDLNHVNFWSIILSMIFKLIDVKF